MTGLPASRVSTASFIFFAVSLCLIAILGAGCGGFSNGDTSMKTYDFRKGTAGISMAFMDNAPPAKLIVGNDFSVGVKIVNEGASDIADFARVEIETSDTSAFRFSDGKVKPFQLTGKSLYSAKGEETVLFFPAKALCFQGFTGARDSMLRNITRKMQAIACYGYETNANADVCVDSKAFSRQLSEKPSCDMRPVIFSGGQGGPVEITRMDPQIIPLAEGALKFQIAITIRKADDKVRIFGPDAPEQCMSFDYENKVPVVVEMGGRPLECDASEIKLQKGGVALNCWRTDLTTESGTFLSPVNVKVKYIVQQSISKDVKIEAPPIASEIDCAGLDG